MNKVPHCLKVELSCLEYAVWMADISALSIKSLPLGTLSFWPGWSKMKSWYLSSSCKASNKSAINFPWDNLVSIKDNSSTFQIYPVA